MGALKSGAFPVELNGKEYGLLFSLNVLDEVQEKFGGYDKLSEVFNKDNPNLFKDTRWLLTLLINEALLVEDENAQLLEEKRVTKERDCLAFICIRAMTLQPQIPRVTHPAYFQEILIMSTSRNIQPV